MPTPKQKYYSTKDVQDILGVSQSKALAIMHQFGLNGKLLVDGRMMRVKISDFEKWENSHTMKENAYG